VRSLIRTREAPTRAFFAPVDLEAGRDQAVDDGVDMRGSTARPPPCHAQPGASTCWSIQSFAVAVSGEIKATVPSRSTLTSVMVCLPSPCPRPFGILHGREEIQELPFSEKSPIGGKSQNLPFSGIIAAAINAGTPLFGIFANWRKSQKLPFPPHTRRLTALSNSSIRSASACEAAAVIATTEAYPSRVSSVESMPPAITSDCTLRKRSTLMSVTASP